MKKSILLLTLAIGLFAFALSAQAVHVMPRYSMDFRLAGAYTGSDLDVDYATAVTAEFYDKEAYRFTFSNVITPQILFDKDNNNRWARTITLDYAVTLRQGSKELITLANSVTANITKITLFGKTSYGGPDMENLLSSAFQMGKDWYTLGITFAKNTAAADKGLPTYNYTIDLQQVGAPVAPTPEPASLLLLGAGLAGLAVLRRRNAHKA